jgi:hypothetical protein
MINEGREEMLKYVAENYDEENLNKILDYYQVSELKFLKTEDLKKVYAKKKAGK